MKKNRGSTLAWLFQESSNDSLEHGIEQGLANGLSGSQSPQTKTGQSSLHNAGPLAVLIGSLARKVGKHPRHLELLKAARDSPRDPIQVHWNSFRSKALPAAVLSTSLKTS